MDLAALRARLPDNIYWELAAPTDDPAVLERRAETARRREEVFGLVQAGEASEEQIRAYYEERRRESEDLRQMARELLAAHGDDLPERDRGLHQLAERMHGDRLGEIPRKLEEALARKRTQDEARAAWERSGRPR